MLGQRRQTDFSGELTAEEQPLRSELFSGDQLEQYGETLGKHHSIPTSGGSDLLLPRLAENRSLLNVQTCCGFAHAGCRQHGQSLITAVKAICCSTIPDLIAEEQIRLRADYHFRPKSYSWQLPRLSSGVRCAAAGFPGVYDIALRPPSRMATADSLSKISRASSPRINGRRHCRSANCGRFRSCCGWR